MRASFLPSPAPIAWVAAAVLSVLLVVDVGALTLTRMSTPERTREAGYAAAQAVEGLSMTQHTAVLAYDGAQVAAADHGMTISEEDFRILSDGRVRLTATRTAPTLLLHRLPRMRDRLEVSVTETVGALPYRTTDR